MTLSGSFLSLGGIWKTSILACERTSALVVVASCAVVLAAAAGLRRAARDDRRLVHSLAGAGVLALVLCALTTVPGVKDALDSAARHAPGLALFRDSHRVLAVVAVALVPGVAGAVSALLEQGGAPGRGGLRTVAALLGVAPVLMLPSLGWGLAGQLDPVTWPAGWREVADRIGPDDRTVVLPWSGGYRGFAWNDHQASLDPAPRQLPGEVLIDDRLLLDGAILPNESPYLARVGDALVQTDPADALRRLGVRWVLVEHGTGLVADIPRGQTVFEDSDLTLIDLGDPGTAAQADTPARPPAAVILGGDLVTIVVLAAGLFRYYRRVT